MLQMYVFRTITVIKLLYVVLSQTHTAITCLKRLRSFLLFSTFRASYQINYIKC